MGSSRHGHTADLHPYRLAAAASRYAAHGWPVIPLHTPDGTGCSCRAADCGSPGKHPRTRRGLHEATIDVDEVRAWWSRWPDANIGIATGAASGLVVLDVDLPDGPASLTQLQGEHEPLPLTCAQRTGSGGQQLLFAHSGHAVRNRTALRPGLDVRGDGGYIVVPPSRHASGDRYRWEERHQRADLPGWFVELLDRTRQAIDVSQPAPPRVDMPRDTAAQRYASAALDRELAAVARAVEGTRNDTLNRAAFNLGQLVGSGLLDQELVAGQLQRVATSTGLGPAEVRRTIASGLSAGIEQPRTKPRPPALSPPAGPLPMVRRIGPRRA